MDKVTAKRTFDLIDERGAVVDQVVVSLGCPEREPGENTWVCPYRVVGLGEDRTYRGAIGVHGLQAMFGVIVVIGGALQGTDEFQAGRLRWKGSAYYRSAFLRVHLAPDEGVGPELGEPIVADVVEEVSVSGEIVRMETTLGHARQAPSGIWFCPYRVVGPGLDCLSWVSGFDSMHAVQSALLMTHGLGGYASEVFRRHKMFSGSDLLGFPMIPDQGPF